MIIMHISIRSIHWTNSYLRINITVHNKSKSNQNMLLILKDIMWLQLLQDNKNINRLN